MLRPELRQNYLPLAIVAVAVGITVTFSLSHVSHICLGMCVCACESQTVLHCESPRMFFTAHVVDKSS